MAGEDYLEIPALGRFAQLGYLYDARTESFHESIFNSKLDENADYIITAQTPSTFQEINYTNSVSDKFNLFNIKAEVSMSILFGLFTVSGSAAFLTEDKKSARQTDGAMILKTRTTDEKLEIYFPSLRPKYNMDLLGTKSGISATATHVVTGVKWGASVAISFAEKFQESHNKAEASGNLAIAFDKLKAIFSMSGSASVEMKGHDDATNSGFQFKVYGDIPLPQNVPETFGEIKQFLKTIPESIQNSNQGRGVRLEYSLTPIGRFLEYLTPDIQQNNYFTKLDESFSQEFLRIFDEISTVEQRLNDLNSDLTAYKICTFDKSRTDFSDLRGEFRRAKDRLKTDMKNSLVKVRSGQSSLADLAAVLQGYMAGQYSVKNIEVKLRAFDEALKKIDLYKTFKNSYRNPSIDYIGQRDQGGSLERKILEEDLIGRVIYIWYIKTEFSKNDPITWDSTAFTFLSLLHQPYHKLIIVDCDFDIPESKNISRTVIKQVINGKVAIEDVHAELERGNLQMKQKPMEVKAIGRIAQLGDLYNARNDSFLDQSILLSGYPASIIIPAKNDSTETELIPRETFEDKCEALGLDTELQLSIMSGLVPLRRSGQYLKENVANSNCARSILCSQFLDEEGLRINGPEFSKFLDVGALLKRSGSESDACSATHFVSKIQFGFKTIFSLANSTCDGTGFESVSKNIGFNLEKEARKFKQILARSFTTENSDFVTGTQKPAGEQPEVPFGLLKAEDLQGLDPSIKIRVFSDIQGGGQSAETVEAGHSNILHYFNNTFFPQLAKHPKGVPISYVLHPIENLQKSHGVIRPNPDDVSFRTISSLGVDPTGLIALYENINRANRKIQTLFHELGEYPTDRCPTDQDNCDLGEIQKTFIKTFHHFSSDLKELILKIKAGQQSDQVSRDAFESFLSKYKKLGKFGFGKDGRYLPLDKVALLETKLELCKNVKYHRGVEYIGRESRSSLDHAFSSVSVSTMTSTGHRHSSTYLLYFKPQWIREKAPLWLSCSQRFFESLRENSRFIVDCDFNHFHSKNVTEPTIYEYKDGRLIALVGGPEGVGASPSLTELYENLVKRLETVEGILRKQ